MNLELGDLFLVTTVVIIAALFWRSHGIRERALVYTRKFCEREDIEFLDDTVGMDKLTLQRDSHGKLRVTRIYRFEFTVTGGERYQGHTIVMSGVVQRVDLPPHRFSPPPERLH